MLNFLVLLGVLAPVSTPSAQGFRFPCRLLRHPLQIRPRFEWPAGKPTTSTHINRLTERRIIQGRPVLKD